MEVPGAPGQVREERHAGEQQPGSAPASGRHGGKSLEHVRFQVSPNKDPDVVTSQLTLNPGEHRTHLRLPWAKGRFHSRFFWTISLYFFCSKNAVHI